MTPGESAVARIARAADRVERIRDNLAARGPAVCPSADCEEERVRYIEAPAVREGH